jgi:hypothetical protein
MITFDESLWPLLTVTFSGKDLSQDFDGYLSKLTAYLGRGEKYLAIFDTQELSTAPSMAQRQRQVEWIQRNESALRLWSLGNAFVITSPFIRLGINIMYQLQPFPCPHTIVGNLKAARAWAAERFRAAGLLLPSLPLNPREFARTSTLGGG